MAFFVSSSASLYNVWKRLVSAASPSLCSSSTLDPIASQFFGPVLEEVGYAGVFAEMDVVVALVSVADASKVGHLISLPL